MLRSSLMVLLAAGACARSEAEPVEPLRVPWLPGFAAFAVSTQPTERADDRFGAPRADCRTGDTRAHRLLADVAPRLGTETVIVSTAHGIVVQDGQGQRIAALPLPCGGSADEVIAIAAGDAGIGGPVIAILATTGGRREATTRVELLRVGDGDRLERVFAAPVETYDGDQRRTGSVRIVPGGLRVRAPGGATTEWRYAAIARRFVR